MEKGKNLTSTYNKCYIFIVRLGYSIFCMIKLNILFLACQMKDRENETLNTKLVYWIHVQQVNYARESNDELQLLCAK